MERADALNDRYRLGSREICLGVCAEDVAPLPGELQDLLERSDSLYRRIARLDEFCSVKALCRRLVRAGRWMLSPSAFSTRNGWRGHTLSLCANAGHKQKRRRKPAAFWYSV